MRPSSAKTGKRGSANEKELNFPQSFTSVHAHAWVHVHERKLVEAFHTSSSPASAIWSNDAGGESCNGNGNAGGNGGNTGPSGLLVAATADSSTSAAELAPERERDRGRSDGDADVGAGGAAEDSAAGAASAADKA